MTTFDPFGFAAVRCSARHPQQPDIQCRAMIAPAGYGVRAVPGAVEDSRAVQVTCTRCRSLYSLIPEVNDAET
jgi:hypothetical protein